MTATEARKTCRKCGRSLPATSEFFHRHPPARDGLKPRCKECRHTHDYRYDAVHPDKIAARAFAKANGWPRRRMVAALIKLVATDIGRRGITYSIRDNGLPLGFTLEEFMAHMERQFLPGMTWENYGRGGWEIDHIMPRRSFCYGAIGDEAFRRCWSLINLRPLWAIENRRRNKQETA